MLPKTISFLHDPAALLRELLRDKNYSRIGVLVDDNTHRHCYPLIQAALPDHRIIQINSGEEHKNLKTCEVVWQALTDNGFDRHSLLVILGGGVLGDLGGFCAATFKRGVDFVLMPTTLLAQCDASIGGKLGIDFQNYKNHIGIFQEPVATLISSVFLKTLPPRELRSGFAEVVKHCLISDAAMWDKVRLKGLVDQPWEELIHHSVTFKHSVITADPRERGLRKVLNFGHTVGHAVEGYFLAAGDRIFHGEAVALGMLAETHIALKKGLVDNEELSQITSYITDCYSPFKAITGQNEVLERMRQDKKNQGNKILMALPDGIGKAIWDVEVAEAEIVDSLDFVRSLQTPG